MTWEIVSPSRPQRSVPSHKEMKAVIPKDLSEGRALFLRHLAEAENGNETR